MADLVIRPFIAADYVTLEAGRLGLGDCTHAAEELARGGPGFTLTVADVPAACAGVILFPYPGVGQAWALLGPGARAHGLTVARGVVRHLADVIQQHRLWRVEADVLADDARARRWVEWMGFEEEGLMTRRGPRLEAMCRYALLPKDWA